eukprot:1289116-Rhodomonas_salina.3
MLYVSAPYIREPPRSSPMHAQRGQLGAESEALGLVMPVRVNPHTGRDEACISHGVSVSV